jgi:phosphoribosylamine--glycine ligase
MIDGNNIKVVEFNARSGDPETEIYMRLLNSDLFEILMSCANGSMDPRKVAWKSDVAVSVALCSEGYPGAYQKGLSIEGIQDAERLEDIVIFHAGTTKDAGGYKTAGGRVLHVTATGDTIDDARAKAYAAIKLINFDGMHYRTDIGLRNS